MIPLSRLGQLSRFGQFCQFGRRKLCGLQVPVGGEFQPSSETIYSSGGATAGFGFQVLSFTFHVSRFYLPRHHRFQKVCLKRFPAGLEGGG